MSVTASWSGPGLWNGFVRAAEALRRRRGGLRAPEPLDEAIDLAERLLLFAEEAGEEVPAEVVTSLVDAKTALDRGRSKMRPRQRFAPRSASCPSSPARSRCKA
jgi:hypothetical protein